MLPRRHFLRLLAAGIAVTGAGCFGSFKATNWAYDFNKSLSGNKFVRWLIFLVMVIIPVYGIAIFIDVWILNSLEFWFGGGGAAENEEDERVVELDKKTKLHMRKDREAGVLYTTLLREGKEPVDLTFEMSEDGARVRSGRKVLAAVRGSRDGGVEVWAGGSVEYIAPEAVQELEDSYQRGGAEAAAAWASANQTVVDTAA